MAHELYLRRVVFKKGNELGIEKVISSRGDKLMLAGESRGLFPSLKP